VTPKTGDMSDLSDRKRALLTRENVEKVLSALKEASKVRASAHISEIVLETGLSEPDVSAILTVLQQEGKAMSVYYDWWKPV